MPSAQSQFVTLRHVTGYPDHVVLSEFRQRFDVILRNLSSEQPRNWTSVALMDDKEACEKIVQQVELSSTQYRIGTSRVRSRGCDAFLTSCLQGSKVKFGRIRVDLWLTTVDLKLMSLKVAFRTNYFEERGLESASKILLQSQHVLTVCGFVDVILLKGRFCFGLVLIVAKISTRENC